MPTQIASTILLMAASYSVVGLAFSIAFVVGGVSRVDSTARDAPWSFRLMILPGVAALWPLMLARWIGSKEGRR